MATTFINTTEIKPTDEEFIAAVEKNGYRKIRGRFIQLKNDGSAGRACAVGQALLNLGVKPYDIQQGLYTLKLTKHVRYADKWYTGTLNCPLPTKHSLFGFQTLDHLAIHLNDKHKGIPVARIGKYLREALENAVNGE